MAYDAPDHACLHCGRPAICNGSRDCAQFCSQGCEAEDTRIVDEYIRHLLSEAPSWAVLNPPKLGEET